MSRDGSSRREEFDWRETGPGDVARGALRSVDETVRENLVWVLGSVVILTLGVWHYQPEWPGLPPLLKVAIVAAIPGVPIGLFVGLRLAYALDTPDTRLLSIQNPVSGDQKLLHVSPTRFERLTVLNHNGEERDRAYLHDVLINGKRAYEVDSYDPEENVAVASWQAGVSNSAIRSDRKTIKKVRTSMEKEADKALELLATHPFILREHASEVSMQLIKAAEGIEVPEGGELHEELASILEEGDPSEALLEGSDGATEVQSPDAEDVFARAAELAGNGHAPADGDGDGGGDGE